MLIEKDLLARLTSDYLSEDDKKDLRMYFENKVSRKNKQYEQEKLARIFVFEKKYPNIREKIKQVLSNNNNRNNAMKSGILAVHLRQIYNKNINSSSLVSFIRNAMNNTVASFKNEFDDNSYYFYLKKDEGIN